MQNLTNIEERFCLHIDFDKNAPDPARIFRALTGMIEAFESLDKHLLRPLSTTVQPVMMLENFEVSSLKTWITTRLQEIDDEHLGNLDWKKMAGKYAIQAKYACINFMSGKTTLSNQDEVQALKAAIEDAAEESGMKQLLDYSPPNTYELLTDIAAIGQALEPLASTDKFMLTNANAIAPFNLSFRLAPETIEQLTTSQTLANTSTVILKVRRPDFVGDTQWEFKHGVQTLRAKINDKDWLQAFQNRQVDVRPGDALKVKLESVVNYDFKNEVASTTYTVVNVEEVIIATEPDQSSLEF
jgi:hypothetical protein